MGQTRRIIRLPSLLRRHSLKFNKEMISPVGEGTYLPQRDLPLPELSAKGGISLLHRAFRFRRKKRAQTDLPLQLKPRAEADDHLAGGPISDGNDLLSDW